MKITVVLVALLVCAVGCGRYGPPIYPESLAPEAVPALSVVPADIGVRFSWIAPSSDQRGRKLSSIDGYRIYRKELLKPSDAVDPEVPFSLVTSLADTHLIELDKARAQLRLDGKPGRRAKVDPNSTKFEYVDPNVAAGKIYLYKVVPFNQGDVEGSGFQLVRVLWRGSSSEITAIDRNKLQAASTDEEF